MDVVDRTKLIIGVIFALVGITLLVIQRGARGFNQQRQAGALLLVAAAVFCAIGLGYIDL
jgi:drug/metabolite transporter (DMT)-like permease